MTMSDCDDFQLDVEDVLPTDSISQFSHGTSSQSNPPSNYHFTLVNHCKVVINDPQCLVALKPFITKVYTICLITDFSQLPKGMKWSFQRNIRNNDMWEQFHEVLDPEGVAWVKCKHCRKYATLLRSAH